MSRVQSPVIPVVADWIRRHPGTISLAQGVVYYGPPGAVEEELKRFLADPENHKYKPVAGLPELVELLWQKLETENGIPRAGHALVVTAGGNMGFVNALLAIADPGDEIILLTPYYFNHEMAVVLAGCRPVLVATDDNYQPRPEAIAAAIGPRTRAVVTISPNNPTGAVYREETLRSISAICRARGLYHISDEAYEYFTYDGARHFSPGSIPGSAQTISLFSLSKAYGFASWRIGYMVVPEALLLSIKKIQDTILICPPVISQYAAIGALKTGAAYCREKIGPLQEIRALILAELEAVRSFCPRPTAEGAFYFLLTLDLDLEADAVVEQLIANFGVALLPGSAFGPNGLCQVRLSYGALQKENAAEGIRRLVRGLSSLAAGSGRSMGKTL